MTNAPQQHTIPSRYRCNVHVLLLGQVHLVAATRLLSDHLAPPPYRARLNLGIRHSHSNLARHYRPEASQQWRTVVHYQELQHCGR